VTFLIHTAAAAAGIIKFKRLMLQLCARFVLEIKSRKPANNRQQSLHSINDAHLYAFQ